MDRPSVFIVLHFNILGRLIYCIVNFLTWAELLSELGTSCRSLPCPPSVQVIWSKHKKQISVVTMFDSQLRTCGMTRMPCSKNGSQRTKGFF